jgi:hypothetical protein
MATQADGMAERDAGLLMVQGLTKRTKRQITVGADKATIRKILCKRCANWERHRT